MAKPNYSWEKRQRELAKKKKKEEKLRRKLTKGDEPDATTEDSPSQPSAPADSGEAPGNT